MSIELQQEISVNSEEEENTEYKVTVLDLFGTILGLIFYLCDIICDLILATWLFQNGYYLYGAFTIISIYLATVIDTVVSFLKNELKNLGSRFWLQYIALSLVNAWGIKIIFSLIVSQCRAYKSEQVSIDIYKKIEQEIIRVARLKLCEVIFETLPQICLYTYLFCRIEQFVSELQTVDLFYVAGLLLLIKCYYFCIAVYENLYKILTIKISTIAIITTTGYGFFSGGVRGFLLRRMFLYPYHSALIILLHVSIGAIYRYRNISNKNQSVYKRWLKSIVTGIVWFFVPVFSIKHKSTFLALFIIHFIGNSLLLVTFINYLTYGAIFYFGVMQAMSLVCWIVYYFCYFEKTGIERNEETLPDDETENLTIEAVSN